MSVGKAPRGLRLLAAFPPGSAAGGDAGALVIATYVPAHFRSGIDASRSAGAWRSPRLLVADAATGALLRSPAPALHWGPDVVGLAADPAGAALVVIEAGVAGARVVHWTG